MSAFKIDRSNVFEDRTKIKNELYNLHDGNVLLPPYADTPCTLEIIPIHDDVDSQVEGDRYPGDGRVADKLGVAEKCGCAMVIGVEEG